MFGCCGTSFIVPILPIKCGARCCTFSVRWMATCVPRFSDWACDCLSAWTSSSDSSPSPSRYCAAVAALDDVAACKALAWNWMVRPSVTNTSYHLDGGSGTLVTSPAWTRGFEPAFLNGRARVARGRGARYGSRSLRTASRWPTRGRLDRVAAPSCVSRTLIRRFEPAAAETREGGAPRVSGGVA